MKELDRIRLQLFAEGAEGAEAAGENGETSGQSQQTAAPPAEEAQVQQSEAEQRIQALEQQLQQLLEERGQPESGERDQALVRQHWQGVEQLYRELETQAEELKQLYPEFDLGAELRDARFGRMLRAGVDMGTAFQALHMGQILPAAMEYAARTVQQRMASAMVSGANRPAENGLRSGGAVTVGSQVSKLSSQEYAKICRMVERGERVSFV